jgi:hypothetical protein
MFEHRGTKMMWLRRGLGMAAITVLAVAALGFVVMHLWNGLLPGIFGLKTIEFWQAVGLLILARLLFGGFRHGHGRGFHRRHHMIQRWESMTPEEREKFRQGFRGRFCHSQEPGQA